MLPLARASQEPPSRNDAAWITGPWFLRDDRMYLLPGDSPMGYRLPLDALPWVSEADYPWQFDQDPFAPRALLPATTPLRSQSPAPAGGPSLEPTGLGPAAMAVRRAQARGEAVAPAPSGAPAAEPAPAAAAPADAAGLAPAFTRLPALGESAADIIRTALCVEVRHPSRAAGPAVELKSMGDKRGILYVFMPPLTVLEDYLALVAEVEATAAELGMKIVLEGYPPPRDPRLKLLQVTPTRA